MWFKPKYSVCDECRVLFEPDSFGKDFPGLCRVHREKPMEHARRKRAVVEWATANWERLEEQAKKESEVNVAAFSPNYEYQRAMMASQQQYLAAQAQQSGYGLFGGIR